tara:strand:- start:272 stop:949 length:678 start_codon:yes stop_codon:yes gene_type:complete
MATLSMSASDGELLSSPPHFVPSSTFPTWSPLRRSGPAMEPERAGKRTFPDCMTNQRSTGEPFSRGVRMGSEPRLPALANPNTLGVQEALPLTAGKGLHPERPGNVRYSCWRPDTLNRAWGGDRPAYGAPNWTSGFGTRRVALEEGGGTTQRMSEGGMPWPAHPRYPPDVVGGKRHDYALFGPELKRLGQRRMCAAVLEARDRRVAASRPNAWLASRARGFAETW